MIMGKKAKNVATNNQGFLIVLIYFKSEVEVKRMESLLLSDFIKRRTWVGRINIRYLIIEGKKIIVIKKSYESSHCDFCQFCSFNCHAFLSGQDSSSLLIYIHNTLGPYPWQGKGGQYNLHKKKSFWNILIKRGFWVNLKVAKIVQFFFSFTKLKLNKLYFFFFYFKNKIS